MVRDCSTPLSIHLLVELHSSPVNVLFEILANVPSPAVLSRLETIVCIFVLFHTSGATLLFGYAFYYVVERQRLPATHPDSVRLSPFLFSHTIILIL